MTENFKHKKTYEAKPQQPSSADEDTDLYADLPNVGYKRHQHMYSPLQTAILFDHFGNPETRAGN
ncbi:MAG: DUF4248 domain-containing protein [Tannerellaceae bacterium]|nr:DUF4248 domain-containing protein [Tannerellaceae bacterium]